jgi:DNA adenine methylase/adenine-specific DNA-methyltransferase
MTLNTSIKPQLSLWEDRTYPESASRFPQLRYMGSKYRLLPWIHHVLAQLDFESALDAFSGSGCVAYLMKSMGKQVIANDFLNFAYQIALATVENSHHTLSEEDCEKLLHHNRRHKRFIQQTFNGIFFQPSDLHFLDNIWSNIPLLPTQYHRALAVAALVRSCIKRQPRGVFTVAGDPDRYKDGRRDLRLTLREHFLESVAAYNRVVQDNGLRNQALRSDVFELDQPPVDLVYMDPPYVPRSDDNCYIKRYHFLEGLSSYWQEEGTEILYSTKVKKIPKKFTPFSYRRTSVEAFDKMFRHFRNSTLVLSYSSNGYPNLDVLVELMKKYKKTVEVFERPHRYHFGTHNNVSKKRTAVHEYLIVGE